MHYDLYWLTCHAFKNQEGSFILESKSETHDERFRKHFNKILLLMINIVFSRNL